MDLGLFKKTAIVTGGASHIGRAISLAFAREGANVVIGDVDIPQAEKTAKEANDVNAGGKAIVVRCDVTNWDSVIAMVNKAIEEFDSINILVNNVGWKEETQIGDKSMWKQSGSFFTPAQLEKIAQAYPLKKIGRAEDVGNAVIFLASDLAAGHITGQVLSVSGGYSMVG